MKVKLVLSLLVVFVIILSSGCVGTEEQICQDVSPKEAFALIENNYDNPDFVVLDVRTPKEYAEEHINGALNLDCLSATFKNAIKNLDKDRTYVIYCRTGGRSGLTLTLMEELGFREVYNILGGIEAWKDKGLRLPVKD